MRAEVWQEARRIQAELREGKHNDRTDYCSWIAADGDELFEIGSVKPARIGPNDAGHVIFFGYMEKPYEDPSEWTTYTHLVTTRNWLEGLEQDKQQRQQQEE